MPANAYLSLTSLAGTRPLAVPEDVQGFRREDSAGRCTSCWHNTRIEGPAPATRYTGEPGVADVCLAYRREFLIARPTTRLCGRFEGLRYPARPWARRGSPKPCGTAATQTLEAGAAVLTLAS